MPCRKPTPTGLDAWLNCSELAARATPDEVAARWWLEHQRWPAWKRVLYAPLVGAQHFTVVRRGVRCAVVGVHQNRLVLHLPDAAALLIDDLRELSAWRREPCARPPGTEEPPCMPS